MNSVILYSDDDLHLARDAAFKAVQRALIKVKQTSIAYENALRHNIEHRAFSGISLARKEHWQACVEAETASLIYQQYSGANHE